MNWKGISKNCLSSDEGYLVSEYATPDYKLKVYVSRCPKGKILHSGKDLDKAKAACNEHLKSTVGEAA